MALITFEQRKPRIYWWTHLDSNQGPLACEASALTGLSYASTGSLELSRRGHGTASPTAFLVVGGFDRPLPHFLRNFAILRVAPAQTYEFRTGASKCENTKRVGDCVVSVSFDKPTYAAAGRFYSGRGTSDSGLNTTVATPYAVGYRQN